MGGERSARLDANLKREVIIPGGDIERWWTGMILCERVGMRPFPQGRDPLTWRIVVSRTRPYQMTDNAFAFRIILSLVTKGTPRSSAVAPIILSMGSRGYGEGNSTAMRVTAAVIGRITKRVSLHLNQKMPQGKSLARFADSWRATPTQTARCRKHLPRRSLEQFESHPSPPPRANWDPKQARSRHTYRQRSLEAFPMLRRDRGGLDIAGDSQLSRIKTEQAILNFFDRDQSGQQAFRFSW